MSIDLYDQRGIFVHSLNAFYESLTETVNFQDGEEVCVHATVLARMEQLC